MIDGPPEMVGARVWGSGGDLGISRDGTHAESIVIPRAAVAVRPTNLTAEQAAAVGVPYVTAWAALDLAGVRAGETVLVAGARARSAPRRYSSRTSAARTSSR